MQSFCLNLSVLGLLIASKVSSFKTVNRTFCGRVSCSVKSSQQFFIWLALSFGITDFDNSKIVTKVLPSGICNDGVFVQPITTVGQGGSGVTFKAHYGKFDKFRKQNDNQQVGVLKMSWPSTMESVTKECEVMNELSNQHVKNIEQCVSSCTLKEYLSSMKTDVEENGKLDERRLILLTPYFNSIESSPQTVFSNFKEMVINRTDLDEQQLLNILEKLVRTAIDIIATDTIVSDLQYLIDCSNGDVLFIDFSEAIKLKDTSTNFQFNQGISSFISELLSSIPENLHNVAIKIIKDYMNDENCQLSDRSYRVINEMFSD